MRELKIAAVMITCPGREEMLKATLADLRSHEPNLPVFVQRDETTFARRQERQEHNALAALQTGLNKFSEAEVLLFFEDDIIFNRHLIHNLQRWAPLRNITTAIPGPEPTARRYSFGSLYDPTVRELEMHQDEHYFIADPEAVYASQAFVLSRATAEYCVKHWWEVPGMQDIKMSRLAAQLGDICYHSPALVQHVGIQSTWTDDARFHDTKSFDRNFNA